MSSAALAPERVELAARLTLLATPGLPQTAVVRLLACHGSGREALRRLHEAADRTVVVAARAPAVLVRVERAIATIERYAVRVIAFTSQDYPEVLRQRLGDHAPPFLFARGDTALLEGSMIAVVGCRAATAYGLDVAAEIGGGITRAGGCVVSGMARGIDGAAHAAALDAGGATIGVLGCGIDVVYPREHRALQERVARSGLLLTEQLPGEPPRQYHFPHRNRIIAGLARAVVVVEAGERSGAVATANHAAGQGVPVFGVPGPVHSPAAQGVLGLFRDGAGVYTGLRDLLESTGLIGIGDDVIAPIPERPPSAPAHAVLWDALAGGPEEADALARRAGMAPEAALVALLELELDGRVRRLPGQRYQRMRARAQ
jgi:DNA processing protein